MTKANRPRRHAALGVSLLMALTGIAAYTFLAGSASATGRALTGDFCATPTGGMFCMQITWDGVTYGTNNRAVLSLRPGEYWLTVTDNTTMHNFALRSCPGSTLPCNSTNPAATTTEITTVAGTPGEVTDKLHLSFGTYRLYCSVVSSRGSHEAAGMFVDFGVGGVGELG
jgi:hypothetical protein